MLVVDVDAASRKLAQRVLRDAGWITTAAENPADAAGILRAIKLNLIVTSLAPDGVDELLVHAHERRVPVIAVSSLDGLECATAVAGTCIAYIRKPIDISTFAAVIEQALGASHERKDPSRR